MSVEYQDCTYCSVCEFVLRHCKCNPHAVDSVEWHNWEIDRMIKSTNTGPTTGELGQ